MSGDTEENCRRLVRRLLEANSELKGGSLKEQKTAVKQLNNQSIVNVIHYRALACSGRSLVDYVISIPC